MTSAEPTQEESRVRRRALALAIAVLVLGVGLVGGGLYALRHKEGDQPGQPEWSPPESVDRDIPEFEELRRRYPNLAPIFADPKVGSAFKEFAAVYRQKGIAGAKELAKERGYLGSDDTLDITLLVEPEALSAVESEVTSRGVTVVAKHADSLDLSVPWELVERASQGGAPEEVVRRLAEVRGVRGVIPKQRPHLQQGKTPGGGAVGVRITQAERWQKSGFRGAGVRVGILDIEVSKGPSFVGTVLPKGTQFFMGSCINPEGRPVDDEGIHGVAVAEIVHQMAHDAELFVACALGDESKAIDWLISNKVRIINFSVGAIAGPRNGTGPEQERIDGLARKGVLWVNSAGNEGRTFHRGTLRGAGQHLFASKNKLLRFRANDELARVTLIWNEWGRPRLSDYDLFVIDGAGKRVASSTDRNGFIGRPEEFIRFRTRPGVDYYLAIVGQSGASQSSYIIDVHGASSVDLNDARGSLSAPADAVGALTIGGVSASNDRIAPYSSRGPTEDGRLKPELSAPTEVPSRVYGRSFGGTSAAAPQVTGAAAVVWGRFPAWTRDQVASFLISRAKDLGTRGPDTDYGYGRLDLGESKGPITPPASPPVATAPAPPAAESETRELIPSFKHVLALVGVGAFLIVTAGIRLILFLARGPNSRRRLPSPPRVAQGANGSSTVLTLVPLNGPYLGRPYRLVTGETLIGSAPHASIQVQSGEVGFEHARIVANDGFCWIMDQASHSGTFVNGARIGSMPLGNGDVITVGPAQFRLDISPG